MNHKNGISSYQGYEYQILATVWIALELIFNRKFCDSIDIEPASGEDISANLNVEPEKANGRIGVFADGNHFEIQVKLRQSGHWTSSKFREVLQGSKKEKSDKGPEQRKRPLDILRSDLRTSYILLTNAQIQSNIGLFEIKTVGEKSKALKIPGEGEVSANQEIAQRIGILSQLGEKLLNLQIDEILRNVGYMPTHKCADCRDKLKKSVRLRLLGQSKAIWFREEIAAEIQKSGGIILKKNQELIRPSNYDEIIQQITKKYKLLLSGPPGTGKTFLAEHIANRHRLDENPFEVVTESKGIAHVRDCLTNQGRFLFFINDPWGHYKLSQDADKWADELPKLLKNANESKRFIITTRIGIKQRIIDENSISELTLAEILLTEDLYGIKERKAILNLALENCNPWQFDIVNRNHGLIMDNLRVPYSLVVFANQLSLLKSESDVDISGLLKKSNIPAIGNSLAKEILEMGNEAVVSAVVLWALIMANKDCNEKIARETRHIVRSGGYDNAIDILKLCSWLIAAKWFQNTNDNFTAHPTVLDGLESLIGIQPGITEDVLLALLNGLVSKGQFPTALEIIKQLKNRNLSIPDSVQKAINIFLLDRLKKSTGYKFREDFFELSKWSTSTDPVSRLVHLLAKKEKIKFLGESVRWVKSELTQSEIERISLSKHAFECAVNFIEEIIPSEHFCHYSSSELVDFFNQFKWDMSNSFLTAALKAIERGMLELDEPIKAVFLYPAPNSDKLLETAFKAYDEAEIWWKDFQVEYQRAKQAELDAAHASHIAEEPGERFLPIETAFNIIVFQRRKIEGYKWIKEHPRVNDLLKSWVEAIDESTGIAEVKAILEKSIESDPTLAWTAIQKSNCTELIDRIIAGLIDSPDDHLNSCIKILCDFLTPDQWEESVLPYLNPLSFVKKAIIWHLTASVNFIDNEKKKEILRLIKSTLNSDEYQCIKACHNYSNGVDELFFLDTDNKNEIMRQILLYEYDNLSIRAAFILAINEKQFDDQLPRFLKSTNVAVRVNATMLAGTLSNKPIRKLLCNVLNDKDYNCRRASMIALAPKANNKEKKAIISMAVDPSAPVRKACAELIGKYKWEDNQSTLLTLLEDKRDFSQDQIFRTHIPTFKVARAAATSLSNMNQLNGTTVDQILDYLTKRDKTRDDIVVHYNLLNILGKQKKIGGEIIVVFQKFLNDSWYMPGVKYGGFPLRYAAAWGILQQLSINKSLEEVISSERLFKGALHDDRRLASPCMICLGMLGDKVQNWIIQLLETKNMTSDQASLILWSLPQNCKTLLKNSLIEFCGEDHPIVTILKLLAQSPLISEEEWKSFLEKNTKITKWLDSIKTSEDIYPFLRFAMHKSFEKRIADTFFSYDEYREDDLSKSIPVITTHSLSGGE